MVCYVSIWFC